MAEHAAESHLPPRTSLKRWLVTTNHKDVGILYMVTSLFFLVFGGVMALLIRTQLWVPGGTIMGGLEYSQAVTTHGLLMVFWFLSPIAIGLANYVVPLQIGAEDLAFPRLNALSYWLYLFSGVLLGASFFMGATFMGGWTMYAPLNIPAFIPGIAELGSMAVFLSVAMFLAANTIGSVNFLTTFYRMRAPGLRMRDIPLFSFSMLLTIWMMLFAFTALLAAAIILAGDHLLGTTYFSNAEGGSLLWTHLFWFFGHPEVYIVFFPALGIMAEVFQTFSGKRLVGRKWFVIAMTLVAVQSFIVWMHHMFLTAINLPTKTIFMATTIGISLPFDLMMFALIYTLIKGKIRFKTPFLFSFGGVVLFIIGGITGVFLGAVVLDYNFRGTYWVVAHFHYVMVAGVTALIGGIYYWFPKFTGRMYDELTGKIHFALYFVGFNLLYFPMFVVWETPRRVFHYDAGFTLWHRVATVGAFVLALSFVVFFYNLAKSLFRGRRVDANNPWEFASSAEWTVPSPPPLENYPDGTPSYSSGKLEFVDPTPDGGTADAATDGGAVAHDAGAAHGDDHAHDHASWWPIGIATAALITGLGIAGLEFEYVLWAALFPVAFFPIYLGFESARVDGYRWVDGAMALVGVALAGIFLWLMGGGFRPDEFAVGDGVVAALSGGSVYFWLTTLGLFLGVVTLMGFTLEGFQVPEPTFAEQWPFAETDNHKLGMWLFLSTDIVLFGALISAYIFMRVANGWTAWREELYYEGFQIMPGLINTYVLLTSSLFVVLALVAAREGKRTRTIAWLSGTFVAAGVFLFNKYDEWSHKLHIHSDAFADGWWFDTNIAASTYLLTTGLHAVHVVIGMVILLVLIVRAYKGFYMGADAEKIELFGLYWHFVDIVWLFLFPLFYIL